MSEILLSKSGYVKGIQCPKFLWLSHYQKDLKNSIDEKTKSKLETGNEINELARKYFGQGVKVSDNYFDVKKAASSTNDLIAKNHGLIFEATAIIEDGCHARIDILKRNESGKWDLIEVKGSTSVKPSHINDLSFQYHVFLKAGHNIDKCFLMVIDGGYVLNGEFNLNQFFKLEDVTEQIIEKQSEIEGQKQEFLNILKNDSEPQIKIGARCFEKKDYYPECDFKNYCWQKIPEYSIFDIYQNKKAEEIAEKIGSYEVKNIPAKLFPTGAKVVDLNCFNENKLYVDKPKISSWLSKLEYPLYFLDYETFQSAVPLFNNSRAYQQIPFQFSLHIQENIESELRHFEFLHQEQSDPRSKFIQKLIEFCGDKGSIICYNQSFEKGRNDELATDFPEFFEDLKKLNERFVDLMEPFRSRSIYHPKQQSSYSIKYVLPAFTDLNYNDMEIANGGEAMDVYLSFIKGKIINKDKMIKDLLNYCRLDTFGMVELLTVLHVHLKNS